MSLACYRVGNLFHRMDVPLLPRVFTLIGRVVFGAYIPSECKIGKRCKIAYGGSGIVIHPKTVIGDDCLISPGVVIGGRAGNPVLPRIGNHVSIYPGAAVLGDLTIGDKAIIGANAVVIENVPPGGRVVASKSRLLVSASDV